MTRVFADSSYWIALLNPSDELHAKAQLLAREFPSAEVVTSEMVFAEVLNAFTGRGPHMRRVAGEAVQGLLSGGNVIVWTQTTEQFQSALKLYGQVLDKSWSITDCVSFQIMRAERIRAALTSDRHFAQAGFEVLLPG
jgi:uncharacterized protein